MIRNFLLSLEKDSHPLLGPTLWGLQTWGLWQPSKGLTSIIYNLIQVGAILFVISQYIELWFIRSDLALALRNLSISMLSTVCAVKASTFVLWQKYWREIVNYISSLEVSQLGTNDETTKKIIGGYTKYSRRVTYFYWTFVAGSVFTVTLATLAAYMLSENRELTSNVSVSYPEIMNSWVPFDKTRGIGYWVYFVEHVMICFYYGGIIAIYDSNAVVIMIFFAGQMELLNLNCSRVFESIEELSNDEAMRKIKDCHYHHLLLIKNCHILNSLLSPVMFLYVVICSLMICANAFQLTSEGTMTIQKIWIVEYLIALIAQLFLYCWHSNEVLIMSSKVDDGVYMSDWWTRDVFIRRNILLLGGQLRKTVFFTAGPFVNLNLSTFIAILKGSYSYYTLLSKKED